MKAAATLFSTGTRYHEWACGSTSSCPQGLEGGSGEGSFVTSSLLNGFGVR